MRFSFFCSSSLCNMIFIIGSSLLCFPLEATLPNEKTVSSSSAAHESFVREFSETDRINFGKAVAFADNLRTTLGLSPDDYYISSGVDTIKVNFRRTVPFFPFIPRFPDDQKVSIAISLEKMSPETKRFVTDTFNKEGLLLSKGDNIDTLYIRDGSIEERVYLYREFEPLDVHERFNVIAVNRPFQFSDTAFSTLNRYGLDIDKAVKASLPRRTDDNRRSPIELDRPWLSTNGLYVQESSDYNHVSDGFSVKEASKVLEEKKK